LKRKFLTNLLLLLFLNLLVKPFWILGIDRSVQNAVGTEQYGFYFSLFSLSVLLNIVLDMGITQYNTRAVARDPGLLAQYLPGIAVLKLLLAMAYACLCLGAGLLLGYNRAQFVMLGVLVFNQFLASFLLYLRSNLAGLHLFRTDSILSVTDRLIMIVVCGLLLWGGITHRPFRIEWFVYAQTFSYLLTLGTAWLLVRRQAGKIRPVKEAALWKGLFRKSLPFALLVLLMAMYYRVDSVMLERMLPDGKYQAGLYAQAFRLLDTLGMFAFLFASLLLPIFSRMIRKGERTDELAGLAFRLLMVPSFIISSALIFFREPLMDMLYRGSTAASGMILAILMVAFLGVAAGYIFGTLLTANGSLKVMNILAFLALAGNVILNLFWIPRYGATGSALASMITQLTVSLLQFVVVCRIMHLKMGPARWLPWVLFLVITPAAGWILSSVVAIPFWPAFAASVAAPVLLSLILRLIPFREILSILQSGRDEEGGYHTAYPV